MAWLDRLELEHPNLRSVLSHAIEAGDRNAALRLCAILGNFWYIRCYFSEGRQWLNATLVLSRQSLPTLSKAERLLFIDLLQHGVVLAWSQSDYGVARLLQEESLWLSQTLGNQVRIGRARYMSGYLYQLKGDYALARLHLQGSLALYR